MGASLRFGLGGPAFGLVFEQDGFDELFDHGLFGGSRSVVARLRGMVLALGATIVPVAALVVLARRLPAHFQAGGDLRPPDAQRDSVVDQGRQLRLGFLPHDAGALIRSSTAAPTSALPAASVLVVLPVPAPVTRLHELHPRPRPPLPLAHTPQDAGTV